jgi:cyclomaltodextrinase
MDPDGDGDPSDGIDGWRLDVAFCVRHPFWKAWRRHVRAINPRLIWSLKSSNRPKRKSPT